MAQRMKEAATTSSGARKRKRRGDDLFTSGSAQWYRDAMSGPAALKQSLNRLISFAHFRRSFHVLVF